MPFALLHALALVKRAAASTNHNLNMLNAVSAAAIVQAADEVISGHHKNEFPLVIWQTGSGTQTNMNMNEVLAHRASEILRRAPGTTSIIAEAEGALAQSQVCCYVRPLD